MLWWRGFVAVNVVGAFQDSLNPCAYTIVMAASASCGKICCSIVLVSPVSLMYFTLCLTFHAMRACLVTTVDICWVVLQFPAFAPRIAFKPLLIFVIAVVAFLCLVLCRMFARLREQELWPGWLWWLLWWPLRRLPQPVAVPVLAQPNL